jgi:hypothetical protein
MRFVKPVGPLERGVMFNTDDKVRTRGSRFAHREHVTGSSVLLAIDERHSCAPHKSRVLPVDLTGEVDRLTLAPVDLDVARKVRRRVQRGARAALRAFSSASQRADRASWKSRARNSSRRSSRPSRRTRRG